MSIRSVARRRPPDPEFPNRPYVRDIYDAQQCGFPIFDSEAFETYRIALTSVRGLHDDPEVEELLQVLAEQARKWIEQHPEPSALARWF